MYIGRGQAHGEIDTTKTKRDEHEGCCEQKHVHQLLLHMERSVDRAVRKKTSIEHLRDSWIKKIFRFRYGLNTKFVKFKDDYLYSSASEDDKNSSTDGTRVKKAAAKSSAKKKGKKQKNYNSGVSGSPLLHTPTEEAPKVAKGDFSMESNSVERHTSTPVDYSNEQPMVDIFSTPRGASTSQSIIISPIGASFDSLVWRLKRLPRTRKIR